MGACQQSDAKINRELTHLNVVNSLYLCTFGINLRSGNRWCPGCRAGMIKLGREKAAGVLLPAALNIYDRLLTNYNLCFQYLLHTQCKPLYHFDQNKILCCIHSSHNAYNLMTAVNLPYNVLPHRIEDPLPQ